MPGRVGLLLPPSHPDGPSFRAAIAALGEFKTPPNPKCLSPKTCSGRNARPSWALLPISAWIFDCHLRHDKCWARPTMASGLVWGQATFRMLTTVSMLQRDGGPGRAKGLVRRGLG